MAKQKQTPEEMLAELALLASHTAFNIEAKTKFIQECAVVESQQPVEEVDIPPAVSGKLCKGIKFVVPAIPGWSAETHLRLCNWESIAQPDQPNDTECSGCNRKVSDHPSIDTMPPEFVSAVPACYVWIESQKRWVLAALAGETAT